MKRIEWENYQDGDSTPLNAENLNLMQDNIEEAIDNAISKQKIIELTTDMNIDDLTESMIGFGQINMPYNPVGGYVYLEVISGNEDNCVQIAHLVTKVTSGTSESVIRFLRDSVWTNWHSRSWFSEA